MSKIYQIKKKELIKQYETQVATLAQEKQKIQTEYDKYLILMDEVEKWQKELDDVKKENKDLKYRLECIEQIKNDKTIVAHQNNNLNLDRSTYQIWLIFGWPHEVNRFRQYRNQHWNDITNLWLNINCFDILAWERWWQEQAALDVEARLYGNLTLVIAFTVDHHTNFTDRVLPNQDFTHRVIVAQTQWFTHQKFRDCLSTVIERYERYENNGVAN